MRNFITYFSIHCHIHQRETKLKFVGKKEDTPHRRKRERETKELQGEQEKEKRIFVRVGTQWQRKSQLPTRPEVDGRPSWQPDVHPKCLARFVRMNCIWHSPCLPIPVLISLPFSLTPVPSIILPCLVFRGSYATLSSPSFNSARMSGERSLAERGRRLRRRRSGKLHPKRHRRAHIGYVRTVGVTHLWLTTIFRGTHIR